jgi:ribonucleotide monophosphatase NagD (HAD superfamily)
MESQNPEKPKIKLPAIACDIDGVALRGSLVIGNADKMIRQILAPRTELQKGENGRDINLPFTFLTNNGGFIEDRKAEELNIKLQMDEEEESIYRLTA